MKLRTTKKPFDTVEKIEVISPEILDNNKSAVMNIDRLVAETECSFGWNYPLDITWVLTNATIKPGMVLLDAGSGNGAFQFYASLLGAKVLAVDLIANPYTPVGFEDVVVKFTTWEEFLSSPNGTICQYCVDLKHLPVVPDESVDIVVALSSLEHNPQLQDMKDCVVELLRVLRTGGALLSTSNTVGGDDMVWNGKNEWLFAEGFMRELFDLPECPSNYDEYPAARQALLDTNGWKDYVPPIYWEELSQTKEEWVPPSVPVGAIKIKA